MEPNTAPQLKLHGFQTTYTKVGQCHLDSASRSDHPPRLRSWSVDLNHMREPARDDLNRRLTSAGLPPRLARTIQRPMGEAGRTGTTTTGQPRNGFILKEFLQRESNLTDKHYTMIQVSIAFLFLLGLISRNRTPSTVWPQSTSISDAPGERIKGSP